MRLVLVYLTLLGDCIAQIVIILNLESDTVLTANSWSKIDENTGLSDLDILKEFFHVNSNPELQKQFFPNRTVHAIACKASKLGLEKSTETIRRIQVENMSKLGRRLRTSTLMEVERPSTTPHATFRFKDDITLIPVGDIHLGEGVDRELLDGWIEAIRVNPEIWWFGMGDLMNIMLKDSVGNIFEQGMNPQEQMLVVKTLLEPIKDKCLGMVIGNHEDRMRRNTSFDIIKMICEFWKVPYLDYSGYLQLYVGEYRYTVFLTHGSGGAAYTPGSKWNKIHRLAKFRDADVFCMGHVHDAAVDSAIFERLTDEGAVWRKRYFAFTGHFLNYESSYADRKMMPPGKKGCIRIHLKADRWDINLEV